MTLHIRGIEPSEYEEASWLILDTFYACTASSMEPQGIETFEAFAAAETMRSRDAAGCATYAAFQDGRLAGVLHVKGQEHISMLFVLPAFQRQGIGRALVLAADRSRRLLTVNSSTNAVASYESYGFGVSGPEQAIDGIRFVPMRRIPA